VVLKPSEFAERKFNSIQRHWPDDWKETLGSWTGYGR